MYGKKKSLMQKRSCYKMTPKSPILRALKGDQYKLPPVIQEAIKAAPTKKYASDAQRKAVHASKAEKSPTKKYKTAMKKMGCAMCGYGKKKCTCGKKKYLSLIHI